MLNQYSIWKYISILIVFIIGGIYAAPNLYGEDPAVQIAVRAGDFDTNDLENIKSTLENAGIAYGETAQTESAIAVRFTDGESQLQAADILKDSLGSNYIVALNLLPATPQWLRNLNALPMYLGLDLRGGVHFLLEVDMDTAIKQTLEGYGDQFRTFLRENDLRYRAVSISGSQIKVRFKDAQVRDTAYTALQDEFRDLTFSTVDDGEVAFVYSAMRETTLLEERKLALTQNITTLRNRVNELGVAEPVIQQQGLDRIVVELPGVQDTSRAKEILGATATLEYRLAHGTYSDWLNAAQTGKVPFNTRLYKQRNGDPVLLKRSVIVTGENVQGASAGFDGSNNLPAVIVTLDGKGASRMGKTTADNINKPMAVVYIENKIETKEVNGKLIKSVRRIEEVISIASIRDQFSKRFQTTGLDAKEARDLALLLRAGALRAPMEIIEERTVGPSLGKDNIAKGFNSVVIGLVLILIFMAIYYRVFGLIADIALVLNIVLIIAVLSLFQATLTMPGIAGIVLTVGMAVDANVLIFERIREELRNGNSVQASIHAGYEKAFATIADANITTFIAAIILFGMGTGPIKGFAITLSIGILTSMFTAIMGTRALVNLVYGGRQVRKLAI